MTSGTPVPGHAVPCRMIPRIETAGGNRASAGTVVCVRRKIAPNNVMDITFFCAFLRAAGPVRPTRCSRRPPTGERRALAKARLRSACFRLQRQRMHGLARQQRGGAAVDPVLVPGAEEWRERVVA